MIVGTVFLYYINTKKSSLHKTRNNATEKTNKKPDYFEIKVKSDKYFSYKFSLY